jgi:hypothetical protein
MSENAAEAAREAIKAAVRGMIEMDRTYDETRAMIEDAFPDVSPVDMASMVKEIGDKIRAQIASRKKATDAVLDEIRETKEHVRDLNERDDVAEGRDEDETQ